MGAVWSAIMRTERERVGESEPRLVNDQQAETTSTLVIYKDKMQDNELTRVRLEGPLTTQRLSELAGQPDTLFIIKFPEQSDDVAYLDTVNYTLHFRGEPITKFLPMLMNIKRQGATSVDPDYTWGTPLVGQNYYMVTDSGSVLRGSREVKFSQSSLGDIPTWKVRRSRQDRTLLSFRQTVDDQEFYLEPIATSDANLVVGVTTEVTSINIYYVLDYNTNNIPAENIIP